MATRKKGSNGKAAGAASTKKSASPEAPARKSRTATTKATASKGGITLQVDSDAIARRAWEIWQLEGCPEGRELDHWLRAEQEVKKS